jgi:hypothetical protein
MDQGSAQPQPTPEQTGATVAATGGLAPQTPPTPQQAAGAWTPGRENPGQLFGILSVVFSLIGLAVVGIVMGVLSRNKSKAVGAPTTLGTVGLVMSIIFTILGLIWFVMAVLVSLAGVQEAAKNDQTQTDYGTSISVPAESN